MCFYLEDAKIQEQDAGELRLIATDMMVASQRLKELCERTSPSLMRLRLAQVSTSVAIGAFDIHKYCREMG